jgi:hypothetical protein
MKGEFCSPDCAFIHDSLDNPGVAATCRDCHTSSIYKFKAPFVVFDKFTNKDVTVVAQEGQYYYVQGGGIINTHATV